jgi:hypothetical protein
VAGCAIAGAALGAGVAAALSGTAPPAPQALPAVATAQPDVLARPQLPADLAGVPETAGVVRSSIRRLVALPSATLLLAGRDVGHDVCLLAVSTDRGTYRAACVPEPAFREEGVGIAWSTTTAPRNRTATWGPDGTIRAGASSPQ